jgi:type IV secretory pathway VirB10-like protein
LSSILRALKKLDEDSISREPETSEQKQKIDTIRVVTRRTRASRVTNRIFFIVLAVVLVGAAAWILLNSINTNNEPPMIKRQDDAPKKPALTHLPQQTPTIKKEFKKGAPGELKPPAANGEQLKPSTKATSPVNGQQAKPDTSRLEEPVQPAADQMFASQTNDQEQLIKQTVPPEFILKGVLWSDNPERRIALINDRYLKEGDAINEVVVVKIERKSVILQSGENKWTLNVKK